MFMEFLILRFVNTIKLSNLTIDDIWKIARKIKSEVSLDKLCPKRTIYYKQEPYPVLSVFEQHLGIKPLEVIYNNITTKFLENAAQMFIYLKGCPAEGDKETKQWYTFWNSFYRDLFMNKTPQQIILTLNRMTKRKSSEEKDGNARAGKLLNRAKLLFSLKFKTIQKLLPGKSSKISSNHEEDHQAIFDSKGL